VLVSGVPIRDAVPLLHAEALRRYRAHQPQISILEFFDRLPWTKNAAPWTAWRAFLAAVFAEPMTREERRVFDSCTGGRKPPLNQVTEAYAICGRRARKSAIGAVIATYLGCYRDYREYLAPGEFARGLIMSKDKDDAGQIYTYARAIMSDPALAHLLLKDPSGEDMKLTNQVEFKIRAIGLTGGRSRAVFFAGLDEFAFWPSRESANPAEDVVKGIRPAMSNIPHALLLGMSTRYSKRGMLYDQYERYYGKDDEVFVWSADSLTMHNSPTMVAFIRSEYDKDEIGAETEYGTQWRTDVRTFLTPEAIDAVTVSERYEVAPPRRAPEDDKIPYFCFVDTSGGVSDAYALAIAHWDLARGIAVLDHLSAWEPDPETGLFSTTEATKDHAITVKRYGITYVTGDHYAGNWPRERWKDESLQYEVTKRDRTKIYRDALPIITAAQCELLDHKILKNQLKDLERRISPKGIPTITHPPGGHDDYANAACGAIMLAYDWGKNATPQKGEKRYKDTHDLIAEKEQEMIAEVTRSREGFTSPWTGLWDNE
jgi:hypothetical protein